MTDEALRSGGMKRGCLFCGSDGPYNTVEHPIPESLGNTEYVLKDAVCDGCQAFFGTKIERPALEKTQLGVWRTHLGIPTKKGVMPSADTRPPRSLGPFGKLAKERQAGFTMKYGGDARVQVDILPLDAATVTNDGKRIELNVALTPWHVSILGRFFGKMALGCMALNGDDDAWQERFDPLRRYARNGSATSLWPVYLKSSGRMDGFVRVYEENGQVVQTLECCTGSFVQHGKALFFAFEMGPECYLLRMDSAKPIEHLPFTKGDDRPFTMLWFPDRSWSQQSHDA
jgi:hypothetical protein